ncbi:ROK family protein [Streptococcus sp. 121]|uniref:ROK family protein n=1 Tax=Streptococcus sp. 121 TaxID=2797637 RepID=UPI0018F0E72E|nr:ROK family protein [Streptococcus sp. 121]MBJ6746318.1 ROK family protein [Streptococcus sp. 121]
MALLVCDLGGTAVKTALFTEGNLELMDSLPTPSSWEEMKVALLALKNQVSSENISGLALSCPGSVDTETGIIYGKSAIPYIHRFPIQAELEELLGLPVSIENDANCAALAELHMGAARGSSSAAFFIIGSGVGGALSIGTQLQKGENLFGGEFGFMLLDQGRSLSQLVSPVQVAQRFAQDQGLDHVTGKDLFDLAQSGHPAAEEAVESLYNSLAVGIYNVLMTVNPELVLLGGAISAREDLVPNVQRRLEALIQETDAEDIRFRLKACAFQNQANLLGAVSHFLISHPEKV